MLVGCFQDLVRWYLKNDQAGDMPACSNIHLDFWSQMSQLKVWFYGSLTLFYTVIKTQDARKLLKCIKAHVVWLSLSGQTLATGEIVWSTSLEFLWMSPIEIVGSIIKHCFIQCRTNTMKFFFLQSPLRFLVNGRWYRLISRSNNVIASIQK